MRGITKKVVSLSLIVIISAMTMGIPIWNEIDNDTAEAADHLEHKANEQTEFFESVTKTDTNLSAWIVKGKGSMKDTEEGMMLVSEKQENVFALSGVNSDDFIYEADVLVSDMNADHSLVFRSSEDGWSSYMLQIVPSAGLIRLIDAGNRDGLRAEHNTSIVQGEIYHLKVQTEGERIKVFFGGNYKPVIDIVDSTYTTGYLGLHVWDGEAIFQNINVSDLKGDLGQLTMSRGTWKPDLKGRKGTRDSEVKALEVYNSAGSDFVLEGNVMLPGDEGEGALAFRLNEDGSEGYEAAVIKQDGKAKVQLKKMDGGVIQTSAVTYPSKVNTTHHLEIHASGAEIQIYMDGYESPAIHTMDSTYTSGYAGLSVSSGAVVFQHIYLTDKQTYYTEKYRPAYHYTPARGSVSDPNGLVYFEGEYHLFHQDGGTWAHAVSTDLIHWRRLPIALPWNDHGHVWSGSAVADLNNVSGLFDKHGGKGLIAYYTSYNPDAQGGNQRIGLAYSTDHGRNWTYSQKHPIVLENPGKTDDNPGGWDFRDPKVVRDDANDRWIMVVSGGDHIRFFTSVNLIDWTHTDNFGYGEYVRGGVWECPDLFQMSVDDTNVKKWVLMISTGANPNTKGSDSEYFIGELTAEGKFVNDNPAGFVLKTDFGKEFYASMSFSDMPDNRRIILAWMTNWDYPFAFPTSGWKGQLTIPREVKLRQTGDGPRLFQEPIQELASLRSELLTTRDEVIGPHSANLLKGLTSGAYEIEAEFEIPAGSTVSEFGFHLREGEGQKTVVGYNPANKKLFLDRADSGVQDFSSLFTTYHEADMISEDNRVKLHILVDEASVEVFGNNGQVVLSDVIFPDPASRGMSLYVKGDQIKVASLKVHSLGDIWVTDTSGLSHIRMDTADRELQVGQLEKLQATVENGKGTGSQPIKWKSSHPEIAAIVSSGHGQTVIKAISKGETMITASLPNGKDRASIRLKVHDGQFKTNLSGWKADLSASKWLITENGIRGKYDRDANYIAKETAGDFTYEAEMKLGEEGAGSILFRASKDGSSGYYFNLDPNLKAIRLFYKMEGAFSDRQVLARVPAFIKRGEKYKVKIEAKGSRIMIELDGKKVIDLYDGTFVDGHFGVNVFGGEVYYQNVQVSDTQEAVLNKSAIINYENGTSLYTSKSHNGEPVMLKAAGDENQIWVLVPTGDELDSYSIRTAEGKALDLDTGQNRLQLYNYLGYNNQRWLVNKNEDGTYSITSVHSNKVLGTPETGTTLLLSEPDPQLDRQKWKLKL
ncbi:GH32 C-terminal domain-containing protein [Neobacillus mesonae]|nr:GH32 C-terminal domain-containing protein [Neobacillus mesonae]